MYLSSPTGSNYVDNARLVLQCAVRHDSEVDALLSLVPNSDASDLHLTVLHVGRGRQLYDEVAGQTGVDFASFATGLAGFLHDCTAKSQSSYTAAVDGTAVLGPRDGPYYLTAVVEPDDPLIQLRQWSRNRFKRFLDMCGVLDAEEFLSTSLTVGQHSPTWLPHITLRKSAEPLQAINMARVKVTFGPLHVR